MSDHDLVWIPPQLHPGQRNALAALETPGVRFVDLTCGTKWGKTVFAGIWLCAHAWEDPNARARWVAPIYPQTLTGWRTCRALVGPHGVTFTKTPGQLEAHFPSGGVIEFRSGDRPDGLAGEGVTRLVIDEAGRCKSDVWSISRTTLTATRGPALRIGTPKGRNWFWREWLKGQDPAANPANRSFRCPTWENPHIAPEEIEQAKLDIPDMMFRQEYGAEFVDDADIVFANYEAVLSAAHAGSGTRTTPRGAWAIKPYRDGDFVAGVDLAKAQNWTVVTVFDRIAKHLVYFDRFHKMGWEDIRARIVRGLLPYHPQVLVDSTGVGDPVLEGIRKDVAGIGDGLPGKVRGFKFTSTSKQQIIENLQLMVDKGDMTLPDLPEIRNELQAFEYTYNHQTRNVRYAAPGGMTDDVVDSLALAAWQIRRKRLIPAMQGVYD